MKSIATLVLFLVGLSLSCESPKTDESNSEPVRISWPEDSEASGNDNILPPFDTNGSTFQGSGRFNSVFWVDFEGSTVSNDDSFIVGNIGLGAVRINPFQPSDINSELSREELIEDMMVALVDLFPNVDIRFTTERPFAGQFSRVHVGGRNFTGRPGVLGIAPLDLGNRSGSDVLFVFSNEFRRHPATRGFRLLVQAIAHEIAHSLGARHIENEEAIMNPFAVESASSFDKRGFVVGEPDEIEHSLEVLINSAGSIEVARQQRELPLVVDIAAFASNGVIQYSVISQANMAANPNKNLSDYKYIWQFEGRETEGSSVLMTFADREDHLLELEVIDDENGSSTTYQFLVGRRP